MINKILCFMWGHTYKTKVVPPNINKEIIVFSYTFFEECKHCGARK